LRTVSFLVLLFSFSVAALAADLKLTVVDAQTNPVAGAQVLLLRANETTPVRVNFTAASGTVAFDSLADGDYTIRVLAPGFAPESTNATLPKVSDQTISLRVAGPTEMVVVSATRTPALEAETGTSVSTLDNAQLETMQPVASADAIRFLPGAVVNTAGQRGGIASLFVRGGDSRYNKVIIDGVAVNEPGGTFDFGTVPMAQFDRLEFLRGAQSTLYGSDAMTSVVQFFSASGYTRTPQLEFGADGGNLYTAHGYANLAGALGRFDYNAFADQFNTEGQGPNDDYSNSLQGANVGVRINDDAQFRLRVRHANSRTGVQDEWNFNGNPLIPPDMDERARQNNLIASAELSIMGPSRWQHRFTGFEYWHKRLNEDDIMEPARVSPLFGPIDFPFKSVADLNRAGFDYQGGYTERSWAQTTFGYEFEDENGFVGDLDNPPLTHGLRLNQAVYGQQSFMLGRFTAIVGGRFVHNTTFGNKGVPRVALTYQIFRGGDIFSGTRLRFSYGTGIKEPRFDESFASGPFIVPNPNLKAEENRAFEAGFEQSILGGKYAFSALYFNNQFHNQIEFVTIDPTTFVGQYVNLDKSMAHGAELEINGKLSSRLRLDGAYNYTSTQILSAPQATDPTAEAGAPLLRRPRHSGSLMLDYAANRWGANLSGSFVGRRPDSDFLGFGYDHAAGYARFDLGGWYQIFPRVTAYLKLENLLNKHYEEVVGYPALHLTFRAGLRFRLWGE
jgi:outer membrane cobalamin receptor